MPRLRSLLGPGLAVALASGGWLLWRSPWNLGLVVLASLLLLLALFAPRLFAPLQRVFESFGRLVAAGFTWLVLLLLFLLVFLPGRLLLVLFRRDPLHRRPDPRRSTYWEPLPPAAGPEHFRRQY